MKDGRVAINVPFGKIYWMNSFGLRWYGYSKTPHSLKQKSAEG